MTEGDPTPGGAGRDVGSSTPGDAPARRRRSRLRRRRSRLRRAVTGVAVIAIVVAAVAMVRSFVLAPYYIPSQSMEPTLHGCPGCDDDRVLVDKLSYHLHAVHRGDVVVFARPATWLVPDDVLIKRVIGLPGDRLSLRHGHLYINGVERDEPYVNRQCPPMGSLRSGTAVGRQAAVPPHQLFVMGDNRCDSSDSRVFGPVPERDLIGRAVVIIWPLSRVRHL